MNCFSTGSIEYRYQEILLLRDFWEPRDKNSCKFLSKHKLSVYILFSCCLTPIRQGGGGGAFLFM